MAKKPVKAKVVEVEPEPEVEAVVEVVEEVVAEVAPEPEAPDTELQELSALLAGHNNAPPEYLSFVLTKANHLSKYSSAVQLAVLMMRSDFNVVE